MTDWEQVERRVFQNERLGLLHVVPESDGYYRMMYRTADGGKETATVNPYKKGPRSNWGDFVGTLPEGVRDEVALALVELERIWRRVQAGGSVDELKKPSVFKPDPDIIEIIHEGKAEQIIWEAADLIVEGQYLGKRFAVYSWLTQALSREEWLHKNIYGPTREGKTWLESRMGRHLLGKDFIHIGSTSPKALIYVTKRHGTDYFRNKVILIDDIVNSPDFLEVLKKIADSSNEVVMHLTVTEQNPEELILDPPPLVDSTSIDPVDDPQLQGRMLMSRIDISLNQERRVMKRQSDKRKYGGQLEQHMDKVELARNVIHHLRRLAHVGGGPIRILIPYSDEVRRHLRKTKGLATLPLFFGLVQAVTIPRLHQRLYLKREDGMRIYLAEWPDIRDAVRLWLTVEKEQTPLPQFMATYQEVMAWGEDYTAEKLSSKVKFHIETVRRHMRQMVDLGMVEVRQGAHGLKHYKIVGRDPDDTIIKEVERSVVERQIAAMVSEITRSDLNKYLLKLAERERVSLPGDVEKVVDRLMPSDIDIPSDTQIALTNLAKKNKVTQRQVSDLSIKAPGEVKETPPEPESSVPPPPPLEVEDIDMSFVEEEQPTEAGEKGVQSPQSDEEEPSDDEEDDVEVVIDEHGFQHLQWRGDDRLRRRKHG